MDPRTSSALAWTSSGVLLLGLAVMSPSAQVMACAVASALAVAPAFFGRGVPRAVGGVVLLLSLVFAYYGQRSFEKEQQDYRKRLNSKTSKAPGQARPAEKK